MPGDLPNFYVELQEWDGPSEIIDDLETDDDLEGWLEDLKSDSLRILKSPGPRSGCCLQARTWLRGRLDHFDQPW